MASKCHAATLLSCACLQCQGTLVQPSGFASCRSTQQWMSPCYLLKGVCQGPAWHTPWPLSQVHQLQDQGGHWQLQITSWAQRENAAQEDAHSDDFQETQWSWGEEPQENKWGQQGPFQPVRLKGDPWSQERWGHFFPNHVCPRRRRPGKAARSKTR